MPTYRPEVVEELVAHGIRPMPSTPPALVRRYLNELYRYEIRKLRRRLLNGDFPKQEYLSRVVDLRSRYPLLTIPIHLWMG